MSKDKRDERKTDRDIDKAVKRNGPGVEALAEAVFGKKGKKR